MEVRKMIFDYIYFLRTLPRRYQLLLLLSSSSSMLINCASIIGILCALSENRCDAIVFTAVCLQMYVIYRV